MGAVQGTHVSVTIDNTAAARITADARTRVIHILAETGMILSFMVHKASVHPLWF